MWRVCAEIAETLDFTRSHPPPHTPLALLPAMKLLLLLAALVCVLPCGAFAGNWTVTNYTQTIVSARPPEREKELSD